MFETRLSRSRKSKNNERDIDGGFSRAFVFLARSLSVALLFLRATSASPRVDSAGPKVRAEGKRIKASATHVLPRERANESSESRKAA